MRVTLLLLLCWATGLGSIPAHAQGTSHPKSAWSEVFDADEAWLAGSVTAGSVVLYRADAFLMTRGQDTTVLERRLLEPVATDLDLVARPKHHLPLRGARRQVTVQRYAQLGGYSSPWDS